MTEQTALTLHNSSVLSRVGTPDEREYLVRIMAETLGIPAKDALRDDVIALLGMAAQQAMTYGALPGIHLHVQKFETTASKQKRKTNESLDPEYSYTLVQGEKLYKDSGARWRIQHGVQWTYQRKPMTPQELQEEARRMGFAGVVPPMAYGMWSRIIMIGIDDRDDPDNPLWSAGLYLGKRRVGDNWYNEDLPAGVSSRDVAIRRADKRAMMQSSLTLIPINSLPPEERLNQLTDHLRSEGSVHRGQISDIVARPPTYKVEDDGDVLWAKEKTVTGKRVRTETIGDINFYRNVDEGAWQKQVAPEPEPQPEPEHLDARPANGADGPCPDCHAPAGKPHATSCPQRAQTSKKEQEKVAARPQKADADGVVEGPYDLYAYALHNPEIRIDPDFSKQIIAFQELHKASTGPMSEAQYKLLRMLYESVLSGDADEHKRFLSLMCGTPIDHTKRPGNKLSSLIDWLKNPNKYLDEIALVQEIASLCREIQKELA